jgi:hypothetical protein
VARPGSCRARGARPCRRHNSLFLAGDVKGNTCLHALSPSAAPDSECIAPLAMTKGYGGGMADQEDWTPGDVASMVANPFYAINIDEGLALPHEPLISEEDWVRANVGLIEELGPEAYLRNLLSILKGNYPRS